MSDSNVAPLIVQSNSLHPSAEKFLDRVEMCCGLVGLACVAWRYGSAEASLGSMWLTAVGILLALVFPLFNSIIEFRWSRARASFWQQRRWLIVIVAMWLLGLLLILVIGGGWQGLESGDLSRALWGWTEVLAIGRGAYDLVQAIRRAAEAGLSPALVFSLSFVVLIGVGTLLLMLPRCNAQGVSTPWLTALFTVTSACCVTGLTVVDTGTFWSRTGHLVILVLIQLGGLGIMTFGAFFTVAFGRDVGMKQQVTMRELLESETLGDVRRLVLAILGLTFGIEFIGAIALSTLWMGEPWYERTFQGVFHAVSAFCNAGFSTRSESLMGWELRWQVWGGVSVLIILGGFGFTPLYNLWEWWLWRLSPTHWRGLGRKPRLSLHTQLISITTIGLLVVGTIALLLLEGDNPRSPSAWPNQVANAWFHSVTLRTAGFNTVDHATLYPASKLLGIALMFVGASPGSTGGGVKTVCLALAILTLSAVLRSRGRVEAMGREIPTEVVLRSLGVIALGLLTVMVSALLVIVIEDRPELVLDHLYEATSAFATVGVSAGITMTLTPASQLIIIFTMFFGRIGPLTLIVALTGQRQPVDYRYPEERVQLG